MIDYPDGRVSSTARSDQRRLSGVGRRRFLRLALAGTVGLLGFEVYSTRDTLRFLPGLVRGQLNSTVGASSVVAVVKCPAYSDALAAVHRAWELGEGPSVQGKRVVLKPNLIDFLPDRPVNTSPQFLEGAINYLRSVGAAEVIVADGPGFTRDSEQLLWASGLGEVLKRLDVPFVDLNYDDLDETPLKGNYGIYRRLMLPRTITRADLVVSVPKMKTHHWAGVSLSLKNMFGIVPGVKYGWPKNVLHWNGITASILTLAATVRPGFALVDGVIGLEGDGPIYGTARAGGVVVAGADLAAVDATATRVMGLDPAWVSHVAAAGQLGFGQTAANRISVRGESIESVVQRFAKPPTNPVLKE